MSHRRADLISNEKDIPNLNITVSTQYSLFTIWPKYLVRTTLWLFIASFLKKSNLSQKHILNIFHDKIGCSNPTLLGLNMYHLYFENPKLIPKRFIHKFRQKNLVLTPFRYQTYAIVGAFFSHLSKGMHYLIK